MAGSWCGRTKAHNRKGIVSNQDLGNWDHSRPLASVSTCDQPECIRKAQKYVAGETNETAVYQSDAEAGVTR